MIDFGYKLNVVQKDGQKWDLTIRLMILPAYIHRCKRRHALFIDNWVINDAWIFLNVKPTEKYGLYIDIRVFVLSTSSSFEIDASFEYHIIMAGFMINDIFLARKHPSTFIARVGLEAQMICIYVTLQVVFGIIASCAIRIVALELHL